MQITCLFFINIVYFQYKNDYHFKLSLFTKYIGKYSNQVGGYNLQYFRNYAAQILQGDSMVTTIKVNGMMCSHCKASVEMAVKALDKVSKVEANVGEREVVVTHEDDLSVEKIHEAIIAAGYEIM